MMNIHVLMNGLKIPFADKLILTALRNGLVKQVIRFQKLKPRLSSNYEIS